MAATPNQTVKDYNILISKSQGKPICTALLNRLYFQKWATVSDKSYGHAGQDIANAYF